MSESFDAVCFSPSDVVRDDPLAASIFDLPAVAERLRPAVEEVFRVVESNTDGSPFANTTPASHVRRFAVPLRVGFTILAGRFGDDPEVSQPTVCKLAACQELASTAAQLHGRVGSIGDPSRRRPGSNGWNDESFLILLGDYFLAGSGMLAADLGSEVSHQLAVATAALGEAKVVELNEAFTLSGTREDYLELAYRKGGLFSSVFTRLAAFLSGAPGSVTETWGEIGAALGMAMQIANDVLELAISPALPVSVLSQGIYPLPVVIALEEDATIASAVERAAIDPVPLIGLLDESGALDRSWDVFSGYILEARELARSLTPGEDATLFDRIGVALDERTRLIIGHLLGRDQSILSDTGDVLAGTSMSSIRS